MEQEASKALINLGDLAKPASTLVKKISDAVGIVYAPTHLKRMARAEVEVDKIRALGRIELTEIEERGLYRLVKEQARIQGNIENITQKAIEELPPGAEPENLEADRVARFFEECKNISNPEMQSVWAKLLAGEANKSGTFSVRTLKLLASMGKSEAESFTQLCGFAWLVGDLCPLIFELSDSIYTDVGINFSTTSDLVALGLITMETFGVVKPQIKNSGTAFYFGTPFIVDADVKPFDLPIGHVNFSKSGRELALICGASPRENFVEYVAEKWGKKGWNQRSIRMSSPWPANSSTR